MIYCYFFLCSAYRRQTERLRDWERPWECAYVPSSPHRQQTHNRLKPVQTGRFHLGLVFSRRRREKVWINVTPFLRRHWIKWRSGRPRWSPIGAGGCQSKLEHFLLFFWRSAPQRQQLRPLRREKAIRRTRCSESGVLYGSTNRWISEKSDFSPPLLIIISIV